MNGCSPHDYVPHCSPAEPMQLQPQQQTQPAQIAMTNAATESNNTKIPPKSAIGTAPNASQFIPQPLLTSSQVLSSNDNSANNPVNAQVPTSYNTNKGSSSANASMFRVQMWSNNFDSGVQSLNHSSAASLLSMSCSSIRCGSSQISTMSSEEMDQQQLTDQQQQKFDKIPASIGRLKSNSTSASSTATAVSSVANTTSQESNDENQIRNAIPELINLLCDQDEVVVQRAAIMVQNIAKMDSEQPLYSEQSPLLDPYKVIPSLKLLLGKRSNSPAIIKPTLGALFQISERSDGLEAILRYNEQSNGTLLTDIIQHIKFTGGTAIRYAILTFHTIIADRQSQTIHVRNIERARSNGALQSIAYFLDHECNEKLLSVLVECVRLLCDKSTSQRAIFFQLNGPSKLFHILKNLRYEGLLWRTTQLLKIFSNADPESIINVGGYDILHRQLEHSSQRLIISTLECIRNMSDVPTKDLDVSQLITKLLQLLGAVDPVIVLYCTGILSNLLANNQRNKEFVFMNGAISILYRVLINSYSIPAITPNQQQRVEDIQERALATLRHLCVGHAHQQEAQKGVIQTEMGCEFLLRKLTEMRPSILKQTLQILNKAVLQDCNLQTIKETRLRLSPEYETNFTERIIVVLKVACEQLPSTQMVEEVRVAELIQLSLSTLQLLCRDHHFCSQMVYLMRRSEYMLYGGDDEQRNAVLVTLPIYCLYQRYVDDENIIRSALGLISELACNQEMASVYACDSTLLSAFEHYSTSRNQAFATYAQKAYERTMQVMNANFNLNQHSLYMNSNNNNNNNTLTRLRLSNQPLTVSTVNNPSASLSRTSQLFSIPHISSLSSAASSSSSNNNNNSYHHQTFNNSNSHNNSNIIYSLNDNQMPNYPSQICDSSVNHTNVQQQYHHAINSTTPLSQEAISLTTSMSTNSTELTQQALMIDEREGVPSSYSDNNNIITDMECSSEVWPEDDLSGLSLNDDPFASMFCSHPFDTSQQQSHRIVYPSGTSRISSSISSSETGTPAIIATTVSITSPQSTTTNTSSMSFNYNPNSTVNNNHFYHNSNSNISSMQMGSPEAHAASWHDPSSVPYHNYQL